MDYDIRYAVLDSALIFNQCGPMSACPAGHTKEIIYRREKAAKYFMDNMNKKQGFFIKFGRIGTT